jgi:hypothetical protein
MSKDKEATAKIKQRARWEHAVLSGLNQNESIYCTLELAWQA